MSPPVFTLFEWETLHPVGPDTQQFREREVAGTAWEVELTTGEKIQVWRADDGREYFCHGLTFGGKDAPAGAVSPYGKEVPRILQAQYELIPEAQAKMADIVVWRGIEPTDVVHSAILTDPVVPVGQNYLDYQSRLQSKNGIRPEAKQSLAELILQYGESYNTYRKR
jgi:hypothetical protein